ncbi:MAG: sulfatase-like hydrolase/transferase, partial [Patescibacteria group bacterium]|nr:sulfatase-like hydrolase/transferase [Patescibacteria group bacterium]
MHWKRWVEKSRFVAPYLYVLLVILGVYAANKSMGIAVEATDYAFVAVLMAGVTIGLLLGRIVLKDWDRVLAVIIPAEFLFLNFNLIKNGLAETGIDNVRLVMLLSSLLLLAVWIWTTGCFKKKRLLHLNVVVFLAIGLMTVYYATTAIAMSKTTTQRDSGFKPIAGFDASKVPDKQKPDVYYILLDGYNRADILKRYYGFDNSSFLDVLRSQGFFVADKSRSNYAHSFLSISSTLRGNYTNDTIVQKYGRQSHDYSLPHTWLTDNEVFETFRTMGYSMANYSSWELTDSSADNDIRLPAGADAGYIGGIHLGMVSQVAIDNSALQFLVRQDDYPKIARGIKASFRNAKLIADYDQPTFSFIHILAPHPPYYFDRDGKLLTKKPIHSLKDWEDTRGFAEQTRYVNREVLSVVNKLLDKPEKPVIILASDHGGGSLGHFGKVGTEKKEFLLERFSNLTAIYLPNEDYSSLYPRVTPVNFFRVVLNDQFGQDLKLLPDRQIYEPIKSLYDFV